MQYQLLNNFYTETSSTFSQNSSDFKSVIRLNPGHEIYKGHFPQIAIAPGVVLVQIIKEILMDKFQKKLRLVEGDNIKFLALINPNETPDFQVDFIIKKSEDMLEVNAAYVNNTKSFTKFKGKFKIIE